MMLMLCYMVRELTGRGFDRDEENHHLTLLRMMMLHVVSSWSSNPIDAIDVVVHFENLGLD